MLRYIYMFFVAIFLAAFVGIGIAVFYPEPKAPVSLPYYGTDLSAKEKQLATEFDAKQKVYEQQIWQYNRNASLISMGCAVIMLAVALIFSSKLNILADGLLLGGIFTLLYGIGRGMFTDNNQYRFLAVGIGLAATLILGYVKFVGSPLMAKLTPRPQD